MRAAIIALAFAWAPVIAQDRPAGNSQSKPLDAMRDARHRLSLAATRAIANFRSMESIQENLDARGMDLHPDLVSLREHIEDALNATEAAIDKEDPKAANEALDRAEALVSHLAHRLGGG